MKCNDIQQSIDDAIDGQLAQAQERAFDAHIATCPHCRENLNRAQALQETLRDFPVPPPSANFAERALRHAAQAHSASNHHRYFGAGFLSAAIAASAVFIALFLVQPQLFQADIPMVSMQVQEIRTVNLAFNSPVDIKAVTFSMQLPDNFELSGYSGMRKVTWTASLQKGRNVLSLPVIALGKGNGVMHAQIAHEDQIKSFRIRLHALGKGEINSRFHVSVKQLS